ncbi:FBP domain-containing protein [Microbacterium sp. P01]|uniref:FBP domain-containing protein n=1 Tax=unclassified Microbacterium TaxID=2609290 RepID=UPI00366CAB3E
MRIFTEAQVRASFLNASRSERKNIALPADFDELDFGTRDYLGWRDPKLPNVSYIVADIDDEPVGLLLRQTDSRARSRPQCSWCADVQLPNDVVFYTTKRAGDAGRRGDTVGTLICENFECSRNVRILPPSAYLGFDREAARDRRIDALRKHVEGFVRDVRGDF